MYIHRIRLVVRCSRGTCRKKVSVFTSKNAVNLNPIVARRRFCSSGYGTDREGDDRIHTDVQSSDVDERGRALALKKLQSDLTLKIRDLGSGRHWEKAIEALRSARIPLNVAILGAAITAMGNSGRPDEAIRLLSEMDSSWGVKPNLTCYNACIDAYSKDGQHLKAMDLLDEMKELGLAPDRISYNTVLSGCAKAGEWKTIASVMEEMAGEGVDPDVISYNSLIQACAVGGEPEKAILILEQMKEKGPAPDVANYSTIIDMYSKSGRWEKAFDVLNEMMERGLQPDVVCCGTLVNACCRNGAWTVGLTLLEDMQAKGFVPNIQCYNPIVAACCKAGGWETGVRLLDEIKQRSILPDSFTYTPVIGVCLNSGEWEIAASLLDEVLTKHNIELPRYVYEEVIYAVTQGGQRERAVNYIGSVAGRGVKLTRECFETVIKACNIANDVESASSLIAQMKELGFGPINISLKSAKHQPVAFIRNSSREDSFNVEIDVVMDKEDIQRRNAALFGTRPSSTPVESTLDGLEQVSIGSSVGASASAEGEAQVHSKREIDALDIDNTTQVAHVTRSEFDSEVDTSTMHVDEPQAAASLRNSAKRALPLWKERELIGERVRARTQLIEKIKYMGGVGDWAGVLQTLEFACKSAAEIPLVDIYVLGTAIVALGRCNRWKEALWVLREMKATWQLRPDDLCYGACIQACCKAGELELAISLFKDMEKEGVDPSRPTYNKLMSGLGKAGRWKDSANLMAKMIQQEVTPDVCTFGTVIDACTRAGEWQESLKLLDIMTEKWAIVPDILCYGSAIDACCKANRLTEARMLLSKMKRSGVQPRPTTYLQILSACAAKGDGVLAREFLKKMQECGVQPAPVHYNAAISACCKSRDRAAGLSLLEEMLSKGLKPSVSVYSTLLLACAAAREHKNVEFLLVKSKEFGLRIPKSALDKVSGEGFKSKAAASSTWVGSMFKSGVEQISVSSVSANAQVDSIGNDARREIHASDVKSTVQIAHVQSETPTDVDSSTLKVDEPHAASAGESIPLGQERHQRDRQRSENSLQERTQLIERIEYMGSVGDWAGVLQTLDSASQTLDSASQTLDSASKSAGKDLLDSAVLATAIMELGKCARWKEAVWVLRAMNATWRVRPDDLCYGACIRACCRAGQLELAISVFKSMEQEGVQPSTHTYNTLMSGLGKAGRWKYSANLMAKMIQQKVDPDVYTFATAIDAHTRAGKWQESLKLLDTMTEKWALVPDILCFDSAIDACCKANKLTEAHMLLGRMKHAGVQPRSATYVHILNACAHKKQDVLARELLKDMSESGVPPSLVHYNAAISACCKTRNIGAGLSLLEELKSKELQPSVATYTMLLGICAENRAPTKVEFLLLSLHEAGLTIPESTLDDIFKGDFEDIRASVSERNSSSIDVSVSKTSSEAPVHVDAHIDGDRCSMSTESVLGSSASHNVGESISEQYTSRSKSEESTHEAPDVHRDFYAFTTTSSTNTSDGHADEASAIAADLELKGGPVLTSF